ncbi:hypothetical protein D3C72_1217710 [compost metagenome]
MVHGIRRGPDPGQGGNLLPASAGHLRAPTLGRHHVIGKRRQGQDFQQGGAARCAGRPQIETHVQIARPHLPADGPGHAMAQRGPDLRIVFHQVLQRGAQAQELRVQDGADAQFALYRVAQGADGALEIFHGVQDAQRGRQQRPAIRVGRQPLRRAREERQVQRFLEVLQLQA